MTIKFLLLLSKQGKVRLSKWYDPVPQTHKTKTIKELTALVLSRRSKMCNISEYKDYKIIYRRYASLFFICGINNDENELETLEIIHRFVEIIDKWFKNICELDIIFNFEKIYQILDEYILSGEVQESSKKEVLKKMEMMEQFENVDQLENVIV
ncbi:hypothetical protein WICMUC_004456 [Wickerhamomyces mucosus]|uniref:AP complex subunit sigma n=1 Tax=Wickerhamomyces mucosus TaxID=1378264 RepID=A0A9P8PIC3_9ASCO|nr:hypothetical protein WICMUC_004456 [Wickerhamomyces mucosus]